VTDGKKVVASYKYDAWGNDLTDPQSLIPNPFKYVGGLGYYSDKESGLKLLGVRYYDSQIGRFWSLDPMRDGRNWYGYVGNNPINLADPTGEVSGVTLIMIGIGIIVILALSIAAYYWYKCSQAIIKFHRAQAQCISELESLCRKHGEQEGIAKFMEKYGAGFSSSAMLKCIFKKAPEVFEEIVKYCPSAVWQTLTPVSP